MSGVDIVMVGVIITLIGCVKILSEGLRTKRKKYVPVYITVDTERYLP